MSPLHHRLFPPLTFKDDLERLQKQLSLKASSIFSLFSKSPKIINVNCLSFWGDVRHLSTKSCTTAGLLKNLRKMFHVQYNTGFESMS